MKKQWRRILCLLLSVVMLCALAACDTGTTGNNNGDDNGGAQTSDQKITITEQTLFEHDGIVVTAKEYVYDTLWGEGIKISVTNNSDKSYTLSTDALIVNDCMVNSLFVCEVAPGKTANKTLELSSSELKKLGVTPIGQIEAYFYIYDSTTYETVYTADCVTIKTSHYDQMNAAPNTAGSVLYEQDGIKIVAKELVEDELFGYGLVLYVENKTSRNISVDCEELSVNDYMVSTLSVITVYKNKYTFDDVTVFSTDLEENDITEINKLEMKFHIYDSDTYATIVDTPAVVYEVK